MSVVKMRHSRKPRVEEDSLYNSDAEPDSDGEELSMDDPDVLLQTWLGELDSLKMGLDTSCSSSSGSSQRPTSTSSGSVDRFSHGPRTDSYRLSMAVLEDSQDVELDAILGELCALENQFEKEIKEKPPPAPAAHNKAGCEESSGHQQSAPSRRPQVTSMGGGARPKFEMNYTTDVDWTQRHDKGPRTDSPDNDSAFSDNLSMLSSESSASSGGSGGSGARTEVSKSSSGVCSSASPTSQADQAARIKAEKIKLALEKIKEANIKKLFIKVFITGDGSTKSMLVDEKMSCGQVTKMLADKSHVRMEPRWAMVEHLPDLLMERLYEDHENLVDNLMLWTRDSQNRLLFQERSDKYDLFVRPESYLLPPAPAAAPNPGTPAPTAHMDDDSRTQLIEEFFSASGCSVPEVESELWLKADGKKAWKRHHFVLRASGIYYSPKGRARSSRDLVCLATLDVNQVYYGLGWRKKYKAPTDFCFAIKHPQIQVKAGKHIRYLCADDRRTLHNWIMGARIAKYGRQLQENYRLLIDDLALDDIDRLAHARSFSVASVAPSAGTPTREEGSTIEASLAALAEQAERLSDGSSMAGSRGGCCGAGGSTAASVRRQDSVLSRGSGSSSSKSSCTEMAFDSDHPQGGTIRRKPSMTPKLPLTSTTRLLVKPTEDRSPGSGPESPGSADSKPGTPTRAGALLVGRADSPPGGTLTRRRLTAGASDTLRSTGSSSSRSDSLRSTGSSRSTDTVIRATARPEQQPQPPPPPPPPAAELDSSDAESLPPPPEVTGSTLSLVSLPPPPDELMHQHQPPPPPAAVEEPLPPPPAELPPPMHSIEPIYSPGSGAVPKRVKKISFGDTEVVGEPVYGRSKAPPPPPPKRSQSTRLSSRPQPPLPVPSAQPTPNRLGSPQCNVTPPREFLRDLQRVMHKKWSVAEKCKVDLKSPHEVLGFRDPFTGMESSKEQHVGQWLQQHYGGPGSPVSPGSPVQSPLYDAPRSVLKKRPPPPPRRNDSTHLSAASPNGHVHR